MNQHADRQARSQTAIMEALETGLCTADGLAEQLGVSVRSIYRNIARLKAAGVPIRGEARRRLCAASSTGSHTMIRYARRRDRRFAIISTWLHRHGFRLRTINTGCSNPEEPICILIEKASGREHARA